MVSALIDTGASRTLLRLDVFEQLKRATHRITFLKPGPDLTTVSGHAIRVYGTTEVHVNNTGAINVCVVDNISHEMILGDDALRKGKCTINYETNEMIWFQRNWPLQCGLDNSVAGLDETFISTGFGDVDRVIRDNADVFSGKTDINGRCDLRPIEIVTSGPPVSQRAYRTALTKRKLVEDAIDDMLDQGIIRPSHSPWAAPITLVPKRDGTTRFCVDYRQLNNVTRKDQYPLPLIQDIFDSLTGSTIFTTLDLKSGYHQIPVHEDSIAKTAFRCHRGLFEFLRMPFGLANAPANFQRTMDYVLSDLVGKCVMVYIDDIVIFSKSREDHVRHLRAVFDKLREFGLKLKPSKCSFAQPEVKLLGYNVSGEGIASDPDKTAAIANLRPPRDVSEVRSMLGMCGYYRQCIQSYAHVSEPLVRLTRKHVRFSWDEEQQSSFDQLKRALTSNSVMAHPQIGKPYRLYTDACGYAVGAILVQTDDNNVERVVQYVSHQLQGPQMHWPVIEKEAYAVVYAIGKLRPYLYGSDFVVLTDHKPLTCLFTKQMVNTKIQRWGILLAQYGARIEYRRGKNNIRADMLSRIKPADDIATIDTNEWVDPDAWPDECADKRLPILCDGIDLEKLKAEQRKEFGEQMDGADLETSSYSLINGNLYSILKPTMNAAAYPRLVVPSLHWDRLIDRAHVEVGHMATEKTLERLREAYVWPGMRRVIRDRLKLCATCRAHATHRNHVPMGEMPLASYPSQIVGLDLIGPFAESPTGNKYILTTVDHSSGWGEAMPIPNKTNKAVWDAFANHYLPRHGVPEIIITDNGQEFVANAFTKYLADLGVEHRRTTPVHPQSNGRTERYNRSFKQTLAKLINNNVFN